MEVEIVFGKEWHFKQGAEKYKVVSEPYLNEDGNWCYEVEKHESKSKS